tara:strand:+ start:167 stop:334 length:168 start_codon:yes stop_codon:yes gene_type:complete
LYTQLEKLEEVMLRKLLGITCSQQAYSLGIAGTCDIPVFFIMAGSHQLDSLILLD